MSAERLQAASDEYVAAVFRLVDRDDCRTEVAAIARYVSLLVESLAANVGGVS